MLSQRELRKRKGSTVDAAASSVQLQQQLTAAAQNNQQNAVAISQQVGNALVVAANGSMFKFYSLSFIVLSFITRIIHILEAPSCYQIQKSEPSIVKIFISASKDEDFYLTVSEV